MLNESYTHAVWGVLNSRTTKCIIQSWRGQFGSYRKAWGYWCCTRSRSIPWAARIPVASAPASRFTTSAALWDVRMHTGGGGDIYSLDWKKSEENGWAGDWKLEICLRHLAHSAKKTTTKQTEQRAQKNQTPLIIQYITFSFCVFVGEVLTWNTFRRSGKKHFLSPAECKIPATGEQMILKHNVRLSIDSPVSKAQRCLSLGPSEPDAAHNRTAVRCCVGATDAVSARGTNGAQTNQFYYLHKRWWTNWIQKNQTCLISKWNFVKISAKLILKKDIWIVRIIEFYRMKTTHGYEKKIKNLGGNISGVFLWNI